MKIPIDELSKEQEDYLLEEYLAKSKMKQRKYPCCNTEISEDDIWNAIDDSGDTFGNSSKNIFCPNCKKLLIVYLNIESIEIEE